MAIARMQWGGRIFDGSGATANEVEIWSNTLSTTFQSPDTPASVIDRVAAALKTYFTSAGAHIVPNTSLDFVKFNEIDPQTGKQVAGPTVEHVYTENVRGGGSSESSQVPITTAVRISLSNGGRGRSGKGGWFSPTPDIYAGPDFRWQQGDITGVLVAAESFINALNGIGSVRVGVYTKGGATAFQTTTIVRVGNVPDNLRSRKNAMDEVYASRTITP